MFAHQVVEQLLAECRCVGVRPEAREDESSGSAPRVARVPCLVRRRWSLYIAPTHPSPSSAALLAAIPHRRLPPLTSLTLDLRHARAGSFCWCRRGPLWPNRCTPPSATTSASSLAAARAPHCPPPATHRYILTRGGVPTAVRLPAQRAPTAAAPLPPLAPATWSPLRWSLPRSHAQAQRAQYAAELRAQIEAKEAARNAERAHSLRQSVALLELRRRAGNAVLPERPVAAPPSAGGAASGMGCTDMQRGGQLQEAGHGGWAGEAPPPAHHQRQAAPWQGSEQRAADPQAAWSPPYALLPPAPAPGWAEPEARWGWSDAPASAEQPLYRTRLLPQGYPPSAGPAMPSDGFHSAAPVQPSQLLVQAPWGTGLPLPPLQPQPFQAAAARAPFGTDLSAPPPQLARSSSLRMQLQSSHAAGGGLLPWADVPTCTPHKGCCGGGASRLAPIGGGELEGQAVREALAQRRAAYKADLEAQMRLKQELQRQVGRLASAGQCMAAAVSPLYSALHPCTCPHPLRLLALTLTWRRSGSRTGNMTLASPGRLRRWLRGQRQAGTAAAAVRCVTGRGASLLTSTRCVQGQGS